MTMYPGLTVLFVGDLNPYSNSYSRLKAFRTLCGHVVAASHVPTGDAETGVAAPSPLFRIAWKLGIHLDTEKINSWLLRMARESAPGLIWIEKGNMIRPGTLRSLREMCPAATIVSYTDDDMFSRANRTWAYSRGLRHYDVVFTTKSYNADAHELPALGARKVLMVDKAYDSDSHQPVELSASDREWLSADVGFIGSYERDRADALLYLARHGIRVRVWGNGWDGFRPAESNLVVEHRALVNTEENPLYTKGICATRINLAFLRKANRDLHTDRSIEIPACAGFMMGEYSQEHARLFEEGKEAVFFRSREDLLQKVRYFCDHEDERSAIAAAGRRRCLKSGYSHADRVSFMLDSLFGG
jgi:hypothetical protein